MDAEDGDGWCELIYAEALKLYRPSKYEAVNKLRFLASILELFAEIRDEDAIVEVKAVNVKFKFRCKSYDFSVFTIPDFKDRKLYLAYMSCQLSKL
jgi:predicted metalloendopeptidase